MKASAKVLFAIIAGLAVLLPFASDDPDGLETVAQNADVEEPEGLWHGLMPDYSIPAIENPYFSTLASGIAGIFLVLIFTFLVGVASTRIARD
ncbi:MAG: cobalt transport protein CbiN [Candidatus Bathyarchaeota archaeon BA2]|nr:MAG: cobalt transport protein CbiN [Candidatus Bathyarchaeota archaeon BA2]